MAITIFVCGVKDNGNPMVSFGDDYWSHKCSVFEIDLSDNDNGAYELNIINYEPSKSVKKHSWFLLGNFLPGQCSIKLMKDLLNAETCFIILAPYLTVNDDYNQMLRKLNTNLEWMYMISYNDDAILMNPRSIPRHVLSVGIW